MTDPVYVRFDVLPDGVRMLRPVQGARRSKREREWGGPCLVQCGHPPEQRRAREGWPGFLCGVCKYIADTADGWPDAPLVKFVALVSAEAQRSPFRAPQEALF